MATAPRPQLNRPRVRLQESLLIGPGKADLLKAIAELGSISAAARSQGMGYRRAWTLLDELQTAFGAPLIQTIAGGKGGGGASLTQAGQALVDCYAELELTCEAAAAAPLSKIKRLLPK